MKINSVYLVSRLIKSGPTNQALNLLSGFDKKRVNAVIVTLSEEDSFSSMHKEFIEKGIEVVQLKRKKWNLFFALFDVVKLVKERNIQFISFTAVEEPHVISLVGYNKFISNIELEVREPADSTADIPTASYESINFRFINEGLDLEVSLPNGVTEVHHIYEKFLTVPKTASDSVIIEGTGYKLLIHSYYAYQDSARRIIFSVLYN